MARHHTFLDRLLDLKPLAFSLCDATLGRSRFSRLATGFFPDFEWPADARVIHDLQWKHRLFEPRHDEARAIVTQFNVDVPNPMETAGAPDMSRTMVAEIADVVIPGHTLTPASASSGKQISLGQRGKARWAFAYPAPVALKRIRISEPCLAIPPLWHYTHLLTDVLMPICEAVRVGAINEREGIVIVSRTNPPMLDAFIEGIRLLGIPVRHLKLEPTQHVLAECYLYARSHCPNIERIFGVPEALPTAHAIFGAAYRDVPPPPPAARLYLRRRNHRLRVVAGEEEMIGYLEKAGFRVMEPNWGNHAEQIAACAGADVIAAMHGAALANSLFCKPGATVVEIMAENARKTTVLHWAGEAGAKVVPLLGGPEGAKQSFAIEPRQMADAIIRVADAAAV